ncbi:MAG: hypothetical protein QXM12_01745 [Nitrososphaerota archaeon]
MADENRNRRTNQKKSEGNVKTDPNFFIKENVFFSIQRNIVFSIQRSTKTDPNTQAKENAKTDPNTRPVTDYYFSEKENALFSIQRRLHSQYRETHFLQAKNGLIFSKPRKVRNVNYMILKN